jgi:MraZ protein
VFLGQYSPRLDDKGRLTLPAKFRDGLASGVVIAKGQERCLNVWPAAAFGELTERMRRLSQTSRTARDFSRVLFSGASDEIPDKQGRITLPSGLRDYAALTKDCVVIGNNDHVEIWDAQAWESYLGEQDQTFASITEEVLLLPEA